MPKFCLVGPGYAGDESFDRHCIFGNLVVMNFKQMIILRSHVEALPRPVVKPYVLTMSKGNVIPGEGMLVSKYHTLCVHCAL